MVVDVIEEAGGLVRAGWDGYDPWIIFPTGCSTLDIWSIDHG